MDEERENGRRREEKEGAARGWRERKRRELVCCVGWEFGMRESSGRRADSRRHATRAHEKLWLLPPVNGEGQPTKNNITFYGQPNFVARWWASARNGSLLSAAAFTSPPRRSLTTSVRLILAPVIDHRKTFLSQQNRFRNERKPTRETNFQSLSIVIIVERFETRWHVSHTKKHRWKFL